MSGRARDLLFLVAMLTSLWAGGMGQQWPLHSSCGPCRCLLMEYSLGLRRYVNCSSLSLSSPPKQLPPHMDVLDLSHNAISSDSLADVCKNRNVQELNLSHNEIYSLKRGAFAGCAYLISLDISGNRLSSLESNAFDGLSSLQFLFGLETYVLEPSLLKPFKRLKELKCIYHGFALSPHTFGGPALQKLSLELTVVDKLGPVLSRENPSLLEVRISGRNVRFINDSLLIGLSLLKCISLHFPSLPSLSRNMFYDASRGRGVSNLQYLTVQGVFELPPDILHQLVNLRNLTLRAIKFLPRVQLFDGLSSLEHLNLSESRIGQIPTGWFLELSSLSTLSMREAHLESLLKEDFLGLRTLRRLDLSHNSITEVEALTFAPMRNFLQTLNLENNVLKKVDSDIFSQLVFLQELSLGSNKLSSINESAFTDLSQLHTLRLHDNKLVLLPLSLFGNQINLRILDLSSNAFLHLPRALLSLSGGLQVLNLDENMIGNIPQVLLTEFPNLKLLSLQNNPVLCNCDTEVMVESRPRLRIIGTCEGPPYFYGKSLTSLSTSYFCQTTTPNAPTSSELDQVHISSTQAHFSTPVPHSTGKEEDVSGSMHFVTSTRSPEGMGRLEIVTVPDLPTSEPRGDMFVSRQTFKPTSTYFPRTISPGSSTVGENLESGTSQTTPTITTTTVKVKTEAGDKETFESNTTGVTPVDDRNETETAPEEGNATTAAGEVNNATSPDVIQPNPTWFHDKYRIPDSSQEESSSRTTTSTTTTSGDEGEHVIAPSSKDVAGVSNVTALGDIGPDGQVRPLAMAELVMILASVSAVVTVIVATYVAWFKRRQRKRNTYVIRRRTFSITSV